MGQVHHPPLFSDEWFEFHAELLARFKRYRLSFGIAALLAVVALLMMKPAAKVNSPQKVADISDVASSESFVPALPTGHYLPGQFYEQQKKAATEELPPQFQGRSPASIYPGLVA